MSKAFFPSMKQAGMKALSGQLVVVKYGGAAMIDPSLADAFAEDIAALVEVGARVVVVHGGGPALTRTLKRLGVESTFVGGQRVTCKDTAETARMVLSGATNQDVVARLCAAGVKAVGLSGSDARLFDVVRHQPGGQDIGFVGRVTEVRPDLLLDLSRAGYVPVVSSVVTDSAGQPYNVNADGVAGALAAALGASRVVFVSDTPGVLSATKERVPVLDGAGAEAMLANGTASGGMQPKLESALHALAHGAEKVHLIDGTVPHALLLELEGDEPTGTWLCPSPGPTSDEAAAGETRSAAA